MEFSAPNAATGTRVTATVSCDGGRALVAGGGQVTDDDSRATHTSVMTESYPSAADAWTVVGEVSGLVGLAAGARMTVTAHAICAAG
jgi:hypothetical protein